MLFNWTYWQCGGKTHSGNEGRESAEGAGGGGDIRQAVWGGDWYVIQQFNVMTVHFIKVFQTSKLLRMSQLTEFKFTL